MDFFSVEFWAAVAAIVFIDLVLSGDNAVVIAMAARNLKAEQQKKVIFWGMFGAIAIRAAATIFMVKLLALPWLLLIGGLLLAWISYKLLVDDSGHDDIKAGNSVASAIGTIILADATMGLDNVIAVAGVAHESWLLVIFGLVISIPIIIWGSTLFIKLINRYPVIIYIGSGILAYTAGKMITDERRLAHLFEDNPALKYGLILLIIIVVLALGRWKNSRKEQKSSAEDNEAPAGAAMAKEIPVAETAAGSNPNPVQEQADKS